MSLKGEMDLPFTEVGSVVQSLARVLVDRGHEFEDVQTRLMADNFDEDWFWDLYGGPATDELARQLGLPPFPDEGFRITSPDGSVRYGSDSEYGR